MKHRLLRPLVTVVALFFLLLGSLSSYADTQKTKSSGKVGHQCQVWRESQIGRERRKEVGQDRSR